jgi:hypothetical protein
MARVLHPETAMPAVVKRACDHRKTLSESVAYEDLVGARDDATYPAEVVSEGGAQLRVTARVAVGELRGAYVAKCAAERTAPLLTRKARQVGNTGSKVEARQGSLGCDRLVRWRRGLRGDHRLRARSRHEISFGDELLVRFHHDPSRQAEIAGEGASRRERKAAREPTRANRVT